MDTTVLTQLVGALGPVGFVMWMVWRNTNYTIPRLAKSFENATDRQRQDFKEMFNQQRGDFERILTRQQEIHESQSTKAIEAIKGLTRAG